MQLSSGVQGFEPNENLSHDISDDFFGYFFQVVVNEVSQGPRVDIFDEHKERLLVVISEVVLDD